AWAWRSGADPTSKGSWRAVSSCVSPGIHGEPPGRTAWWRLRSISLVPTSGRSSIGSSRRHAATERLARELPAGGTRRIRGRYLWSKVTPYVLILLSPNFPPRHPADSRLGVEVHTRAPLDGARLGRRACLPAQSSARACHPAAQGQGIGVRGHSDCADPLLCNGTGCVSGSRVRPAGSQHSVRDVEVHPYVSRSAAAS